MEIGDDAVAAEELPAERRRLPRLFCDPGLHNRLGSNVHGSETTVSGQCLTTDLAQASLA
jgi:hypothetical protein